MDEEEYDVIKESVWGLLESAPEPVKKFILNELPDAVRSLMERYHLRVDQGGILERELFLLLVGQEDPAKFSKSLIEEGNISQETTSTIIRDVNETVFKRLQREERGEPIERKPAPPAVPVMRVGEAAPQAPTTTASIVPEPAPAPQPQAAAPAPTPPIPTTAPVQAVAAPVAPPASVLPPVPVPPARTMASDMEMLAHGLQGNPISPARSFQTASVPVTRTQVLPQTAPPQPTAPPAASYVPPSPQPPPEHAAPKAAARGADPYREPFE